MARRAVRHSVTFQPVIVWLEPPLIREREGGRKGRRECEAMGLFKFGGYLLDGPRVVRHSVTFQPVIVWLGPPWGRKEGGREKGIGEGCKYTN